jgi:hypothetical protein
MFNLSDKELDRLSREAADKFEVKPSVSSWEALEKKLDLEFGNAPAPGSALAPSRGLFYPLAYSTALVLLIGGAYFFLRSGKLNHSEIGKNFTLSSQNKDNSSPAQIKTSQSANQTGVVSIEPGKSVHSDGQEISSPPQTKASKLPSINKIRSFSENRLNQNLTENETRNSGSGLSKENVPKGSANRLRNSSFKTRLPGNSVTGGSENAGSMSSASLNHSRRNLSNPNKPGAGENPDNLQHGIAKGNQSMDNKGDYPYDPAPIRRENLFIHAGPAGLSPVIHLNPIRVSDSLLLAEAMKQHVKPSSPHQSLVFSRPLEIGITVAPEISKAKINYIGTPLGVNFGMTLDYHVLGGFSLNSGLTYAKKFYQAAGKDFHPNDQIYVPQNTTIGSVKGSLKMIDLPLNIRYDFRSDEKTFLFISAGLSSYLIQRQEYNYVCINNPSNTGNPPPNIPYYNHENDDVNKSEINWFSVLNLSAGFETSLSNSLSFQMNPYFKIPLRGVGAGDVSLSSYGIAIALKYSPVLKKSRR